MPSRKLMGAKLMGAVLVLAVAAPGPAGAAALFVSNERDNTVTVLDTTNLTVLKTISVGTRPRGIVITPDHAQVLVCNGDSDDISVIDARTFAVVRKLSPGPDPETLALSPDGAIVYVSNEDDSMVTMLDFKSGQVIARIPVGIEPEGLAVAGRWQDRRRRLRIDQHGAFHRRADPQRRRQRAGRHPPARRRIRARRQDGVGSRRRSAGTVAIIDAASREVVRKISFDLPGVRPELISPVGLRFSADGKLVFVALGRANHVAVIDAATGAIAKYILVGDRVWQLVLDPDGKTLYAANGLSNDVSVIDIARLKVSRSVPVGRLPWGLAIRP